MCEVWILSLLDHLLQPCGVLTSLCCGHTIPHCLTTLSRCSSSLLLEVTLKNLLHLRYTHLLASGRPNAIQCVRRLYEDRVVDDDLVVCPSRGKSKFIMSAFDPQDLLIMVITYVLARMSKISCASRLTPLPFCASFFFISRIVCSSRAMSAAMSTFAMLGTAPSKPAFGSCVRSPRPMISKDTMCAKGMM